MNDFPFKIEQLIRQYGKGHYTQREFLPRLALYTPEGKEAELVQMLPSEVLEPFRRWVETYPLEGGIKMRDTEPDIPIGVIIALKQILGS